MREKKIGCGQVVSRGRQNSLNQSAKKPSDGEFRDGVLHVIISKSSSRLPEAGGGNMRGELWIKTISTSLVSEEPKSKGPSAISRKKDEPSNLTPNGQTGLLSNLE